MNKIMMIILAFLTLIGCRTRKVETTQQKQVQKEHFIKNKDSSQALNIQAQKSEILAQSDMSFIIELESDKDSTGQSKEIVYTRIRDGDTETIRVSGGKVKLTQQSSLSNSQITANATLTSTTTIANSEKRTTESTTTISHKTKNLKNTHLIPAALLIAAILVTIFFFKHRKASK